MAVIDTAITFDREGEFDERAVRKYRIVARLRTNTNDDGPGVILQAVADRNITIGTPWQEPNGFVDMGARCKSIKVKPQDGHPRTWLATCEFDSAPPGRTETGERGRGYQPHQGVPGQGGSGRPTDPTLRPPEVRVSFEKFRRVAVVADRVDPDTGAVVEVGVYVRNSAGFPFDPAPEVDDTRLTLTVGRNEADFSADAVWDYIDTVNDDEFLGFAPGTVKFEAPEAEEIFEGGLVYWRVTYHFSVTRAPYGWDREFLDAGFHDLDADGKPKRILDRDGNPVTEPYPLDGEGVGILHSELATFTPVYRVYRVYERRTFAPLGLD